MHEGSYNNGKNPQGSGCYIGFAEGSQSTTDVGKFCYCYSTVWNSETRLNDALWVMVDQDTPHLEIGYAEFSKTGEKFYFDGGPTRFHQGDQGNYLFKTKRVNGSSIVDTYFIFEDMPGTVAVIEQEDGSILGPGGWMVDELTAMPDLPSDFTSSGLSTQDYLVSCHAEGSYLNDPTLSGLHPTLKFHYDFKYKLSGTSYNDLFPLDIGRYGTGKYAQCFTDTATDQIGDMVLSGVVTAGTPIPGQNTFYMWRGGLKDSDGHYQFHVAQYLFPELNPNYQPYSTYTLRYYNESQAWVYKTASANTYMAYKNGVVRQVKDGAIVRDIAVNAMDEVGVPRNFRGFDGLYHHIDDTEKIFLAGDQLVFVK